MNSQSELRLPEVGRGNAAEVQVDIADVLAIVSDQGSVGGLA